MHTVKQGKTSYKLQLKWHIQDDAPFKIRYTSRTFHIERGSLRRSFTDTSIRRSGMTFMQKVKRHVIKNDIGDIIPKHDYISKGLKRFSFNRKYEGKVLHDVVELDLNKAYWVSAYNLGVISKEIYEEGLTEKYNKIEILACLGQLAKKEREVTFENGKFSKSVLTKQSEETRHIWDAISYEVDECMREMSIELGSDFLFYWTDAIFFIDRPDNIEKVKKVAEKRLFELKKIDLEYIDFQEKRVYVYTKLKDARKKYKHLRTKGKLRERIFTRINTQTVDEIINRIMKPNEYL